MSIGDEIQYTNNKGVDIVGEIVEIKKGNQLTNIKTGESDSNTVKLKIKPNDGGRCFWTTSMHKVGK